MGSGVRLLGLKYWLCDFGEVNLSVPQNLRLYHRIIIVPIVPLQ